MHSLKIILYILYSIFSVKSKYDKYKVIHYTKNTKTVPHGFYCLHASFSVDGSVPLG